MLLNVVLRFVPRVFTATMIATEMPAAMRPYSMAVAPLSSFRKRQTSFLIWEPRVGRPPTRLLNPPFDRVNRVNESRAHLDGAS